MDDIPDRDRRHSTDTDGDAVVFDYIRDINLPDGDLMEPLRAPSQFEQLTMENSKPTIKPEHSPASQRLMDRTPTRPTKKAPHQRVLPYFKARGRQKCMIFLTANSLLQYQQMSEQEDEHAHNHITQKVLANSYRNKKRIFKTPLSLVDYRPLMSPFVPELLRILVNAIEKHCSHNSWHILFESHLWLYHEASLALVKLVRVWYDKDAIKKITKKLSPVMKVMVLRLFLNELDRKPFHFKRIHLIEMSKIPLFDFFLRPHPGYRSIVKHAALSTSCMFVDTAAFLMIHLMHAWEKYANPSEGKVQLANIYGNLLVGFSEEPEFKGFEYHDGKTIESALFEVILETCDSHYWNHLTMLKVRAAFPQSSESSRNTPREDMRKRRDSHLLMQLSKKTVEKFDAEDDEDSNSMDMERISSFHSFNQKIEEYDASRGTEEVSVLRRLVRALQSSQSDKEEDPAVKDTTASSDSTHGMTYISAAVPPLLSFAEFQLISSHKARLPSIVSKTIRFRRTTDILKDLLRFRIKAENTSRKDVNS